MLFLSTATVGGSQDSPAVVSRYSPGGRSSIQNSQLLAPIAHIAASFSNFEGVSEKNCYTNGTHSTGAPEFEGISVAVLYLVRGSQGLFLSPGAPSAFFFFNSTPYRASVPPSLQTLGGFLRRFQIKTRPKSHSIAHTHHPPS